MTIRGEKNKMNNPTQRDPFSGCEFRKYAIKLAYIGDELSVFNSL